MNEISYLPLGDSAFRRISLQTHGNSSGHNTCMAAYDAKHNPQETPLGNWTFIKCSVTHLSKSLIKLIAKKNSYLRFWRRNFKTYLTILTPNNSIFQNIFRFWNLKNNQILNVQYPFKALYEVRSSSPFRWDWPISVMACVIKPFKPIECEVLLDN